MGKEPPQTTFEYVGPDEGLLLGARNILPCNGGGDWVCTKPEHWIFAGTGMKKGDRILYGGYSHEEMEVEGEKYVIVEFKDVVAKLG